MGVEDLRFLCEDLMGSMLTLGALMQTLGTPAKPMVLMDASVGTFLSAVMMLNGVDDEDIVLLLDTPGAHKLVEYAGEGSMGEKYKAAADAIRIRKAAPTN